jgi:hypothetical protein
MKSICSLPVVPELHSFGPRLYTKGSTSPYTLLAPASRGGAPLHWRASAQNRRPLIFGHLETRKPCAKITWTLSYA